MEVIRIAAIDPPIKGRSQWCRSLLTDALSQGLEPVMTPTHKMTSFAANLSMGTQSRLKALAKEKGWTVSATAAGLIEAAKARADAEGEPAVEPQGKQAHEILAGQERVRTQLHSLLTKTHKGIQDGRIVFSEAATGTGKGAMIASLAAESAKLGRTVVISAPLAVAWQLMDDLAGIEEARLAGVTLSLGRANFVSPEFLRIWAEDNDRPDLIDWIDRGGPALTERTRSVGDLTHQPLHWLLEDALKLAEDLPVNEVMLSADSDKECEAELFYQSLKGASTNAGIILCSHHLLAAHVRFSNIRASKADNETQSEEAPKPGAALPDVIDTLIVDEAQLLEPAFTAINSHTLHLRPLIHAIEGGVRYRKKPLLEALNALASYIQAPLKTTDRVQNSARLDEHEGLKEKLQDALQAVQDIKLATLDRHTQRYLQTARWSLQSALSGYGRIRIDTSPVKGYPLMVIGPSNLEKTMNDLWNQVKGGALVSATLYCDQASGNLTRWKLGIAKERALYLPQVHPEWVFAPVRLHPTRVDIEPDDSDKWADAAADCLRRIAAKARGGMLILCTSHFNAQQLSERLQPVLKDRLITQSPQHSAQVRAQQFRMLHKAGGHPVWIGLGAAWTGINLSDSDVPADQDTMLTDLVITRLPIGITRTLTHERRVKMVGFGVVAQEAVWHFRQGLGRLVRREGLSAPRNLWVIDCRLDSSKSWTTGFKRVLSKYPKADSK